MNLQETIKLLSICEVVYPATLRDYDKEKKKLLCKAWYTCLQEYEYLDCEKSLYKHISNSKYFPTVKEILDNLVNGTKKGDSIYAHLQYFT